MQLSAPMYVNLIQHCPKTRSLSLYSPVHHVFSSQIRTPGNRNVICYLYSLGCAPSPHTLTPTLPNTNVLPTNATVHWCDPSMLTETLWQYYHVNEVRLIFKCLWEITGLSETRLPQQLSIVHSHQCTESVQESQSQPKGQHQCKQSFIHESNSSCCFLLLLSCLKCLFFIFLNDKRTSFAYCQILHMFILF